jgi:hypothetical protein
MAKTSYGINTALFAVLLVAGILAIPFFSAPAIAEQEQTKNGNPHDPGTGLIAISELSTTPPSCDVTQPVDDTKGGVSFKFKVPSTITTILNNNNPNNAVNLHVSFVGSDGLYYEAGMYYGVWTHTSGSGYDQSKFQFAWGRGDTLRGVSSTPVVAGHTYTVSLIYLNSANSWQMWVSDVTAGTTRTNTIGSSTTKVASDYLLGLESNGAGPNTNTQTLGLVEVFNLQKAFRVPNDGVELTMFADGYVNKNCTGVGNGSYGATYLGPAGHFKIGYNGATKTNGAQLW